MIEFMHYLREYWAYHQVNLSTKVNGLLYFLKRIPLIGKKIPLSIYRSYAIKQVLAVIFLIGTLLKRFVTKFLWLGAAFLLACGFTALRSSQNMNDLFYPIRPEMFSLGLFIWFFLVVLFMGFFSGYMIESKKSEVRFVDNFQLSKKRFFRGAMLLDILSEAICYLPTAFVYGLLIQQELRVMASVFCLYLAGNLFFQYLGRLLFMQQYSKSVRWLIGSLAATIILGTGGLLLWRDFGVTLGAALFSVPTIAIAALVAILSWYLLVHYKQETDFLLYMNQQNTLLAAKASTNVNRDKYLGEGLTMQKKLTLDSQESFQNLNGSQYLNALLFSRYRSILNKALRYRLYGIAVAWVLVLIGTLFNMFDLLDQEMMTAVLPSLFFIMYLITFGKKIVQLVFVNCDISMLYYPFYREASTILSGFNDRFKRTLFYNGILCIGIFSVFLLATVLNHFFLDWAFLGVLVLLLFSLSLLFSFHELFIYYLLQPFTGDMEVVSPVYKLISGVFYGIAYMQMQMRITGLFYAIGVSLVSLLYVAIGFFVIYKKAPSTFRIRNE